MMQELEISIGQATFELHRVYAGKQPLSALIRAQIEREAAAFDKNREEAV